MQFVVPAQFFLVLWLFAASAPAATALVNGSLIALIDTRTLDIQIRTASPDSDEPTAAEKSRRIDIDLHGTSDFAGLLLLALAQEECVVPGAPREFTTLSGSDEVPIALSSSLLHTAVQRHRPRVD